MMFHGHLFGHERVNFGPVLAQARDYLKRQIEGLWNC